MRDPRTPGLLLGASCGCAGIAVLTHQTARLDPAGVIFAVLAVTVLVISSLPPWQGKRTGPWGGAAAAFLGGLLFLAAAVVATFGFGVHVRI